MHRWSRLLVVALVLATPAGGRSEPTADAPRPTPAAGDGTKDQTPTIDPRSAAEHVGEEVVVEGRVHAVHVSHLATVLAFAPNFAGFTATIHAADRARFPPDVHETARDRPVRLRGLIRTYRGRAEMTLSDPSQLVLLDAAQAPRDPAPDVSASLADELRAALARIETRLDGLERRLTTIEEGGLAPTTRQTENLVVGMPASAAEAALGPPLEEIDDPAGLRVWVYEDGRTLTLDASARVVSWTGF